MFKSQEKSRTLAESNLAIDSKVSLQRTDITKLSVDAVVNAANSRLIAGCGVDGAIHSAAGPDLQRECLQLGGCTAGDAKITRGYWLPARYVIHTVGPLHEDAETLANCYLKCLEVLVSKRLRSIAFCCISTGVYGYPNEAAMHTALGTVRCWLDDEANLNKIDQVIFSVFDEKNWEIYLNEFPRYFPSSSIVTMKQKSTGTFNQNSDRSEMTSSSDADLRFSNLKIHSMDRSQEHYNSIYESKHHFSDVPQTYPQAEQCKPRNSHLNISDELTTSEHLSLALYDILPDLSINPDILYHLTQMFQNDVCAVICSMTDTCAKGFFEKVPNFMQPEEFLGHFFYGQESLRKKDLLKIAIDSSISQKCSTVQILNAVKQCDSAEQLHLFLQKTESEPKQTVLLPLSANTEEKCPSLEPNVPAFQANNSDTCFAELKKLLHKLLPQQGIESLSDTSLMYLQTRFENDTGKIVNFLLDAHEGNTVSCLSRREEHHSQLMNYFIKESRTLQKELARHAIQSDMAHEYDVDLIIDAVNTCSSKEELKHFLEMQQTAKINIQKF